MNLYQITNEYLHVLNSTFDPETGEINEIALSGFGEIKETMEKKCIALASYIKNLEAEKKAIDEAKKEMARRESMLEKRADYLTYYLQSNMEKTEITEISCPYFQIKLKKCPYSTEIKDEMAIPDEYKKRKEVISVDKVKIKEDILAGKEVPGAEVKQNTRLEIK